MNGGRKIRAVFDTNIYISALFWLGGAHHILDAAAEGKVDTFISPDMLDELECVLRRDFMDDEETIKQQVSFVQHIAIVVHPRNHVVLVKEDPDDDMIISCALEAKADYIVTADQHLLKIVEVDGIKIVTTREFLEIIG